MFEAENTWTQRRVAIKMLRPELASTERVVERFLREGRAATRVSHPNIIEILDMGQDPESGSLYIVQEYLSGISLARLLQHKGQLDLTKTLDMMVPVMGALVAAHQREVIHRDVKPENIFLAKRSDGEIIPKLIDFGLSKILDPAAGEDIRPTSPGFVLGTPHYMSPEQLRSRSEVDGRTDIWSAAVVFYEALAGRLPFTADSAVKLAIMILNEEPPRIEQLAPQIPLDMAAMLHRALAKDPDQRFASMRQLLDAVLDCPSLASSVPEESLTWRHRRSIPYDRRHARFEVDWRVALRCPDWKQAQCLVTSNVSRGGVFVVSENPPPVGSRVELRLDLPDNQSLCLLGTVRHTITPEHALGDRRPGVGIQFDEVHDIELLVLEHIAAANLERGFQALQDVEPVVDRRDQEPVQGPPTSDAQVPGSPAERVVKLRGQVAEALGIDLGTTYCSVSVAVGDRVYLVADEHKRTLHPSIVAYPEQGLPTVGWAAREYLVRDPRRAIASIKRLLGRSRDDPHIAGHLASLPQRIMAGPSGTLLLELDGTPLSPIQVAATLLEHLKRLAERQTRRQFSKAVLSVPVGFDTAGREALLRAARIAGLEVLDLLQEPVAGALAYGLDRGRDETVVVYDFGGGTFDFSVLRLSPRGYRVLATAGDPWLGGDDIDQAMAQAVADRFWRKTQLDLRHRAVEWQRLLMVCERAKRALSLHEEVEITVPAIVEHPKRLDLSCVLGRPELERLCHDTIQTTLDLCAEALRTAKLQPQQVTKVVVTGGVCRMPLVRRELSRVFHREVGAWVNPDEAVCLGTGLIAARLVHHEVVGPARLAG